MTNEEAIEIFKNIDRRVCVDELIEALDMAIKALEAQPCEDCISRKDAKIYLSAPDKNGDRVIYEDDLDLLPSVQPKRPTGRWITRHYICRNKTITMYMCNVCDHEYSFDAETGITADAFYCPNCGAEMEV